MWASGAQEDSLGFLVKFTTSLSKDLQPESVDPYNASSTKHKFDDLSKLLARCFFKQGQWQVAMYEDWSEVCYNNAGRTDSAHFINSDRSKIYFAHIRLPRTTILPGIKHGTLGLSPTLK